MADPSFRDYYDAYWTDEGYNPLTRTIPQLAAVLERYVPRTAACLDLGCGDGGTIGAWLAGYAASYLGVDISPSGIRAAVARGLDARLIQDAAELPFTDDQFDAAICVEVLEHVLRPEVTVQEICRVVRPGGVAIFTVPNVAHWRLRLDLALLGRWAGHGDADSADRPWQDPHIRFFTRASLVRLLESCGCSIVASGGYSEIGFLQAIPLLRRLAPSVRPSSRSDALMRAFPTVAALRVYAVAQIG